MGEEMQRLATLFLATSLALSTAVSVAAAEPTPSESPPSAPPEPLGPTVSGGRTEMPGSGFVITFPDDWTVELADPDPDVVGAEPGTAWEALRATAHDGHMACSVVVGVAEVPFFDPPDRAGSATGQGGVGTPFWDPDEPHLLWVPEPVVADTHSSMQTTWDRLQDQDEDLAGDAAYSLLCMTSDADDAEPGGFFVRLMDSFEFLPVDE